MTNTIEDGLIEWLYLLIQRNSSNEMYSLQWKELL